VIVALSAAQALGRAVWYQSRYFGWDQAPFKEVMEETFDKFKAQDHMRFWR
jgi:hypothetical protein